MCCYVQGVKIQRVKIHRFPVCRDWWNWHDMAIGLMLESKNVWQTVILLWQLCDSQWKSVQFFLVVKYIHILIRIRACSTCLELPSIQVSPKKWYNLQVKLGYTKYEMCIFSATACLLTRYILINLKFHLITFQGCFYETSRSLPGGVVHFAIILAIRLCLGTKKSRLGLAQFRIIKIAIPSEFWYVINQSWYM